MMWHSILSKLNPESILAWHCRLCRLPLSSGQQLWCDNCRRHIEQLHYCQRCGATLTQSVSTLTCGRCLVSPPPWHHFYRLGLHQFPLKQVVHQFKFQRQFYLAAPLAQWLAQQIKQPAPVLLPVPLHRYRLWQRGFNQSTLLAWSLAEALNNECLSHGFIRTRHTPPQKKLKRSERQQNLKGAFQLQAKQLPPHVALVDDVVTTGSTLKELISLLPSHIEQIDVYALSYTPVTQFQVSPRKSDKTGVKS
ncbi:ComF family protein [Photobacterium damselae subsp. piscicida]|uniref:ComF family protein n=2 Tax=Photobacterium damselae TaxID=38293 RepID=UPI000316D68A|nr:ComF family protein [Photobacterium damselae]OLQ81895.1 amidophosphoribosyltransferase [Photobacterium damselae subsp. piscicida]TFZ62194.1 ComF family protein [Photobacterium damselae subsp. piscicida]TJZ92374.1 ComF family protein [Photobacterium damselae subsp. piscicida]BBC40273.1 hypothetical protein PDPE_1-01113 [Photobacterium damselae subsp. piscicida]